MSRSLLPCLLSLTFALAPAFAQTGENVAKSRAAADAAWTAQRWEAVSANYEKVVAAEPKDGEAWHRLGYALHMQGKMEAALAAHERATAFPEFAPTAAYNAGCANALLGHKDEAFRWLDKAIGFGMSDKEQFTSDADLVSLHDDERWSKVLEKLAKVATAPKVQLITQNVERMRTRALWFSRQKSPGQFSIEYGAVGWRDEFSKAIGSERFLGKKWRFGGDYWTTLDTSIAATLGGAAVPEGYYYLTLEQRDAETFVMALHDAATVRAKKLDAFQSNLLTGGIEVKMQHTADAEVVDKLTIEVRLDEGQDRGHLEVAFGSHRLTAPLVVDLGR